MECENCYEERDNFIECPSCNFKACTECVQTQIKYEMIDNRDYAKCLKCRKYFSHRFILLNFQKEFIKMYNDMKADLLFEMEKSFFPHCSSLVEQSLINDQVRVLKEKKDAYVKKHIEINTKLLNQKYENDISEQLRRLHLKPFKTYAFGDGFILPPFLSYIASVNFVNKIYDENGNVSEEHVKSLYSSYYYKKCVDYDCYLSVLTTFFPILMTNLEIHTLKNEKPRKTKLLIRKCEHSDCGGVLNDEGACLRCAFITCKRCETATIFKKRNEFTKKHECDPDTVESLKLIRSDTKLCPGCQSRIHRISGCPTIWCTVCKIFFDYSTGKKMTGEFHNPEYEQYLRDGGNRFQSCQEIQMRRIHDLDKKINNSIISNTVHRMNETMELETKLHKHRVSISFLNNAIENREKEDQLRVEHLRGFTSEKKYKSLLKRRYKRRMLFTEIKETIQGFILVLDGLYQQHLRVEFNVQLLLQKMDEIVIEYNQIFEKLSELYNQKTPRIVSTNQGLVIYKTCDIK